MEVLKIEESSFKHGRRLNIIMGIMGVTFAILSNSSALMVDGLYSVVNFASSLIAAKVSMKLSQSADEEMPFGYDYYETLYISFRSLVLLGIISFSLLGGVGKIITYLTGGPVAEIKPGVILIYTVINVTLCFILSRIHKKNYLRTNKRSELLKAEESAAIVDCMISLGAGVALVGVIFMRGTFLEVIIPIADSIVVIVLSLLMIKEPIKLFKGSLEELLGKSIGRRFEKEAMAHLKLAVNLDRYHLVDLKIIRVGRHHHVYTLLKPLSPVGAGEMDDIRERVFKAFQKLALVRSHVIFTGGRYYS